MKYLAGFTLMVMACFLGYHHEFIFDKAVLGLASFLGITPANSAWLIFAFIITVFLSAIFAEKTQSICRCSCQK